MNIDEALSLVKPELTTERYEHTLRVAETAVNLAKLYKVDVYLAELAAIFHDYAKYRPIEELKQWIIKTDLPNDLLDYHHEVWHGPVGSILIKYEHGINHTDVQQAIRYHTTGRAHMSMLEQIIFVSDYIEPGRNFPGVDGVRAKAQTNLIQASWMVASQTIQHLMSKKSTIYPDTFFAYNDLSQRLDE